MKTIIPLILVGLVALAGCSSEEAVTYTCWDGSTVEDVAACPDQPIPEDEPVVEDTPVEEEVEAPEVSEAVEALFQKSRDKVNNMKYTLVKPPTNLAENTYIFVGDLVKIELLDNVQVSDDEGYDLIYVNTAEKTAVGVCSSSSWSVCRADPEQRHEVAYDELYMKSPLDWRDEVVGAEAGIDRVFEQTPSTVVNAVLADGSRATMMVSNFYGMILKLDILNDDDTIKESYAYRAMAINSNKAEDVALE